MGPLPLKISFADAPPCHQTVTKRETKQEAHCEDMFLLYDSFHLICHRLFKTKNVQCLFQKQLGCSVKPTKRECNYLQAVFQRVLFHKMFLISCLVTSIKPNAAKGPTLHTQSDLKHLCFSISPAYLYNVLFLP